MQFFPGISVERSQTHTLPSSDLLSSQTRHISRPVGKLGTYTPPTTRWKDSTLRVDRFTNLGAPTPAHVGAPIFAGGRLWHEKRIERWIRFGRIAEEHVIDRSRRVASFAPGSIFGCVRWAANDYGTAVSRIDILRAVVRGHSYSIVPYVRPGGEILLRISGWPKVERVLQAIDAVEALKIDPAEVCPDHWRHLHNRVVAGEEAHPYTPERHDAWLLRERDLGF